MEFKPGRGLEPFGQKFAGVAFLFEVGDEKLGDGWIVIDQEKFNGIAGEYFHVNLLL
jgi:hypothetical protein